MKFNKENIYFLKPIEVNKKYSGYNKTWSRVKAVFSNVKGVTEAALLKSHFDNNKIGYVSYSSWTDKLLLNNAVAENIILKYHKSGVISNSLYSNLYKLENEIKNGALTSVNSKTLFHITFMKKTDKADLIKNLTKYFNEGVIKESVILKSIKSESDYPYVSISIINSSFVNSDLIKKQSLKGIGTLVNSLYNITSKYKSKKITN